MLDHTRGRWMGIDSWAGQPLYSLSPAVEEGMALGAIFENGKMSATVLAAPGGSDRFLGFAYSYTQSPTSLTTVETFTVPAGGGTVTLANGPLNGASGAGLAVRYASNNTLFTQGTAATGVYNVGSSPYQTLTFAAGDAGAVVNVNYAYSPTVAQALQFYGDGQIGHSVPSDITGTIGLIRRGIIYTSNFNPGADFGAVNAVLKMGPNGTVTVGGSGPTIPGYVYEMPSGDSPTLGIYFTAP